MKNILLTLIVAGATILPCHKPKSKPTEPEPEPLTFYVVPADMNITEEADIWENLFNKYLKTTIDAYIEQRLKEVKKPCRHKWIFSQIKYDFICEGCPAKKTKIYYELTGNEREFQNKLALKNLGFVEIDRKLGKFFCPHCAGRL